MTMVPGSVTDTVAVPGTARRSKPLMRSWVLVMLSAPQRKAAVSPRTATTAGTQYPAVDGRLLAWRGGMGGSVGGGRSSVSEGVMAFASFSSLLTLTQTWATVRSRRSLILEGHWHREVTRSRWSARGAGRPPGRLAESPPAHSPERS